MTNQWTDSHLEWLRDIEYRSAFGAETAKLEIAAAIADARSLARVSQARLAELAGVSQPYIAKLESGDANPTIGRAGELFASLWLRLTLSLVPLEPLTSIESMAIESQSVKATVTLDDDSSWVDSSMAWPIAAPSFP